VGSPDWWAWRPVWVAVLALALVPLVAAFARVELRRVQASSPSAWRAGVAALLVAAGMAFLARKGFVLGSAPVIGMGLVAGGWGLLRRS
jgi:hypothetical protein